MKTLKHSIMWLALALIILLIFLSIYGAFIGAERAQIFFNSLSMAVYFFALTILLAASFLIFRRLVRVPELFFMHAGCILILAGGMWGSEAGHKLQKKLFGIEKIRSGRMVIYEGDTDNHVLQDIDQQVRELPFSIELKDFRMNYYKPGVLFIQTEDARYWKTPAEIGSELSLGKDLSTIKVTAVFENCKISIDSGETKAFEGPGSDSNPAVEVLIKSPEGIESKNYVFERFGSSIHSQDKLKLNYIRMVSDYISDLRVIVNGKTTAEKSIEVNHPLKFGGYHFYQHSYDDQAGQYTILNVVSDTGLNMVYAGYIMLGAGIVWRFWLRKIFSRKNASTGVTNGN